MEKAAIFIDGGYFNRVLKNEFNEPNIDYDELSKSICEMINTKRLRTYFYHCMPVVRKGNKNDEIMHGDMQKFISKLKRLPRFEVKLGRLQIIGNSFKQKMVDVLMSLDIVDMCFSKKIEHAVIIAGDSDFIPAIKKAKDCGAIVHLFHSPKSVHTELLDEVDELHIISKEFVDKCLIK